VSLGIDPKELVKKNVTENHKDFMALKRWENKRWRRIN